MTGQKSKLNLTYWICWWQIWWNTWPHVNATIGPSSLNPFMQIAHIARDMMRTIRREIMTNNNTTKNKMLDRWDKKLAHSLKCTIQSSIQCNHFIWCFLFIYTMPRIVDLTFSYNHWTKNQMKLTFAFGLKIFFQNSCLHSYVLMASVDDLVGEQWTFHLVRFSKLYFRSNKPKARPKVKLGMNAYCISNSILIPAVVPADTDKMENRSVFDVGMRPRTRLGKIKLHHISERRKFKRNIDKTKYFCLEMGYLFKI